jgi:hypothetical protein
MNLEKLLSELVGELEPKVVKTIPMKPKWEKEYLKAEKIMEEVARLASKLDDMKVKFWKMIEKEAKLKGKDLHYNEKKNVIEVLE